MFRYEAIHGVSRDEQEVRKRFVHADDDKDDGWVN